MWGSNVHTCSRGHKAMRAPLHHFGEQPAVGGQIYSRACFSLSSIPTCRVGPSMCPNICLTWEEIFQGSPAEVQSSSDGRRCCAATGGWALAGNPSVAMTTPCTYVGMASAESLSLRAIYIFFFFCSKSKQSLPFRLSHVQMLESGTGCGRKRIWCSCQ